MNPIPQNNNICPMGIWSGIADDAKNINYPFFLLKIVVSTFCRICIFFCAVGRKCAINSDARECIRIWKRRRRNFISLICKCVF